MYNGHGAKHFESEKEFKDRTFSATNVETNCKARKQFLPLLKEVVTKEGRPIKTVFG